jgi:hypothetical protein
VPGYLRKRVAAPAAACCARRQHWRARVHRNRRAAGLIYAALTGCRARAFGEYDDPEPALQAVFALREHLL